MRHYANYHKHDHISSMITPDTHIKAEEYIKRAVELGDTCFWTTNHGCYDIFEAKSLCDQYGLHCKFGLEGYIVANPLEKDKQNFHIMLLARTDKGRKLINYANSHAHIDGYYYKPRLFIEDLLNISPNDIYITTACVTGILKNKDAINDIFNPLMKHFQDSMFIEVQAHNVEIQKMHNKKCLEIAMNYGLRLIAATDSHYIYPTQSKERDNYLAGKNIKYDEEDAFILDYPDGDTLYNRFLEQGILSNDQIESAINNTLLFEECEDIQLDKSIKMPNIYPDKSVKERIHILKNHVNKAFQKMCVDENITIDNKRKYIKEIKSEMDIIEKTSDEIHTCDYFLFNEKNTELAVDKYGGVLTRTGRGSCASFIINKLLGMTQIDRLRSPVPLYKERFMSEARLLENHALPDIDFNVVKQEPFQKASKELLGEHGCYPMIAYGTMQEGEAFRNICRCHNLDFNEYNDVAKNIDNYKNNEKWKSYIEESQRFIGSIVSSSPHPCAHILDNKDLRYEYGVVRIGDAICVPITSGEADTWKMLKNDYLIVSVWKLISETFTLINKPIMSVYELENNLDEQTFDLFNKGLTATLNQADTNFGSQLAQKYKIHSVREAAMFTAALRPSFESWRDKFMSRENYSTDCKELDDILESTDHYILYQENLMAFFEWLDVTPAESIGLIKKISKKKIKQSDFDNLETRLHDTWLKKVGNDNQFKEVWGLVQSCISYGFCSAHGLATGLDMLYGAYLKSHYPLEYYTVCFNNYADNKEKTAILTDELKYFGIKLSPVKFRYSSHQYSFDKNTNTIYKSIFSIKGFGEPISKALYESTKDFTGTFMDYLGINPCSSSQTIALIKLGFFSEFGKSQYLLDIYNIYDKYYGRKQINKTDAPLPEEVMLQFSKATEKRYNITDNHAFLDALCSQVKDQNIPITEQLSAQKEFLGYIDYINPKAKNIGYVMSVDTKYSPKIELYCFDTGKTMVCKIGKKDYNINPIKENTIIKYAYQLRNKTKKVNDEWVKLPDEYEPWFTRYQNISINFQ